MNNLFQIESMAFDIEMDKALAVFEYQMDMIENDIIFESEQEENNKKKIEKLNNKFKQITENFVEFIKKSIKSLKEFIDNMVEKIKDKNICNKLREIEGKILPGSTVKYYDVFAVEKEYRDTMNKLNNLINSKEYQSIIMNPLEGDAKKSQKLLDEVNNTIDESNAKIIKIMSKEVTLNAKKLSKWILENEIQPGQYRGEVGQYIKTISSISIFASTHDQIIKNAKYLEDEDYDELNVYMTKIMRNMTECITRTNSCARNATSSMMKLMAGGYSALYEEFNNMNFGSDDDSDW